MTEWIQVGERLPEKDGPYLVMSKAGNIFSEIFTKKEGSFHEIVTHWAPLPQMPKKKRWFPKKDEPYYFISSDYNEVHCRLWVNEGVYWNDIRKRASLGVYKTQEEASLMAEKIQALITAEIGEP